MSALPLLLAALALQTPPQDSSRAAQDSALRVFLDCPNAYCDFDYYRTEITFVNWVRDRRFAQLHLLITTQGTGSGSEYTLAFIGLERFAGDEDTLRFLSGPTDTDDDIRKGLAGRIRLGLVRFAAKTPVGARIEIAYTAPPQSTAAEVRDRWNYWVFSARVGSNYFAEESQNFFSLNTGLSANRTTQAWKWQLSVEASYNESNFHFQQDSVTTVTFRNLRREYESSAKVVRSLGPHWSAGIRSSVQQETFSNEDLALRMGPVIEFDIFPYSQSTRRLLTVQVATLVGVFDYADTTLFDKTSETLVSQAVTVSLDVKEPWGSAGVALQGAAYWHDFSKHHVGLSGNVNLRLFKGLSLFFFGNAARVKDRLSVAKAAGSTPEEVLLQRRQLGTDFAYQAYAQLRFTFGSKFANVVNPRVQEVDF